MTLLEAVASEKPFRLRNSGQSMRDPNFEKIEVTRDELLSGDWEISKEMVLIDKEELEVLQAQASELKMVNAGLSKV